MAAPTGGVQGRCGEQEQDTNHAEHCAGWRPRRRRFRDAALRGVLILREPSQKTLGAGSIPPKNAGCFAVNACRSIDYVYARTVCVFLALQRSARAACGSNAAEFAWKCTREQRIEAPTGGGRYGVYG